MLDPDKKPVTGPVKTLRFGIPTLDQLCGGYESPGIHCAGEDPATTSLSIAGTVGTGKSVLGLHLASRYLADCSPKWKTTRVLYASTDLSEAKAREIWTNFGLGDPRWRSRPFELSQRDQGSKLQLNITAYGASDLPRLARYLDAGPGPTPHLALVDLNASTAGDDWSFVNRILALLPDPDGGEQKGCPRHMLIVDAVEGLETLVGELDSFGERRSRRSRVAQALRTAGSVCHIVFIVEEARDSPDLPERFVTDVAIRLNIVNRHGYDQRTVQVLKARAQAPIQGEHAFTVRDGSGSGRGPGGEGPGYPDDPEFLLHKKPQAYVHVFHSLDARSRLRMRQGPPATQTGQGTEFAGFGIPYLDEMLAASKGLPTGSMSALIGDSTAPKARLGRAFLSRAFGDRENPGVAALITTDPLGASELSGKLQLHLNEHPVPKGVTGTVDETRVFCRSLEASQIQAAVLFHIIEETVLAAIRKLRALDAPGRVRLVIDDWSQILNAYPDVRENDRVLPAIREFLKDQGVTTLVIITQPGRQGSQSDVEPHGELRRLFDHVLYAWDVSFFGKNRFAITANPPIVGSQPGLIRELRAASGSTTADEALEVDPRFELYSGLERDEPQLIPMRVRLYAETDAGRRYAEAANGLFEQHFRLQAGQSVVGCEDARSYQLLRDSSRMEGAARKDHTLVIQMDEFWRPGAEGQECRSTQYLQKETRKPAAGPDLTVDPFRVYQPTVGVKPATTNNEPVPGRLGFFAPVGYQGFSEDGGSRTVRLEMVPYMWDFGLLLCRAGAWERAVKSRGDHYVGSSTGRILLTDVWNALVTGKGPLSWRQFFEASRLVARERRREGTAAIVPAFDISMLAPETLSCLVLEVWASEIELANQTDPLLKPLRNRDADPSGGLINLLRDHWRHLYRANLLLESVIGQAQFGATQFEFDARPANPAAVSSRHWYSTASDAAAEWDPEDPLIPVSMPGTFSVRGDWFVAVAEGSRSMALGDRAIDLLSRSEENARRMHLGLGLPVRHVLGQGEDEMRTALQTWYSKPWLADGNSANGSPSTRRQLHYGELKGLGARAPSGRLQWLWRSRLQHYERHARIWSLLLCRMMAEWPRLRSLDDPEQTADSLAVYDGLIPSRGSPAPSPQVSSSWDEFGKSCGFAQAALEGATPTK